MSTAKQALPTRTRLNIAWGILVAATGIGWWFGHAAQGDGAHNPIALAGVIVTAFFKAWIVGVEFMELRAAPRWLRHGYDAWIVAVAAALLWISLR
jgi:cytochrome c oxidase subunit 4